MFLPCARGLDGCGESDFGYGRVGGQVVAESVQDFENAVRRIARRTAHAPEAGQIEHLSAAQVREKFPPLREGLEAIFILGAAHLDGRRLCQAMLCAAARLGATITEDKVTLSLQGDKVICRGSDGRTMEADEIIVTAGAWAAELLKSLGVEHIVKPQKGQIIHLHLPATKTADWPALIPALPLAA